jgi:hypothetical protein
LLDLFLRNSEQANSFDDLKQLFTLACPTESACKRMWSINFVTDKITLLLELNQQVDNKKKARVAAMGHMGNASPQTKLRRINIKIVKAYGNSLLLHNGAQRLKENSCL